MLFDYAYKEETTLLWSMHSFVVCTKVPKGTHTMYRMICRYVRICHTVIYMNVCESLSARVAELTHPKLPIHSFEIYKSIKDSCTK